MKINYQKVLDATLAGLPQAPRPKLLLHACCAPCSSYVIAYLSQYFDICLYFYNPNIAEAAEYERRLAEVRRLVAEMGLSERVTVAAGAYEPETFYAAVRGLEDEPEGGARCTECFTLRLAEAAAAAQARGADYFTTTLTISPHKDSERLNAIGQQLAAQAGVPYLCSDFKKREGFKRSTALSAQYGLYRQDYCGCVFSKRDAASRHADD